MPNFWENDPVAAPAQPAPRSGGPQPIYTAPDPQGDLDNARKADADARAAATQARADRADTRAEQSFGFEQQDRDARGGVATTEAEKTAAFLATRVAGGIRTLATLNGAGDKPGIVQEGVRNIFGETAANLITGSDRQRVEAAQLDVLDAALTLGTGAAYTKEQLAGYQKAYFPQIGDSDATVADKRTRLAQLMEAARVKAGAAAPQIEQALSGVAPQGAIREPEMAGGVPVGTEVRFGMDGAPDGAPFDRSKYLQENYGINPDQEAQIIAFWNQNIGNGALTIDGVRSYYQQNGLPVPSDEAIQQGINGALEGKGFGSFDTSQAETAYQAKLDEINAQRAAMMGEGGNMDLASQGVMAGLGDQAAGIGSAVGKAITGDFDLAGNYTLARDAELQRLDQLRAQGGAGGVAAELLGNAASMGTAALTSIPATSRAAMGEAALAGAVPGFGYGEGTAGSLAGAGIGAGLGAGLGKVLFRSPVPPSSGAKLSSADNYAAAQKFGMDISPGDAGGMSPKIVERILDVQPASGSIMNASRTKLADQMIGANDDVAATFGATTSFREMGDVGREGSKRWMTKFDRVVGKAYDAIPIANGRATDLTNTRQTLGELLDVFRSNPEMRGMFQNKRLAAYLDALTEPVDEVAEAATNDVAGVLRTIGRKAEIPKGELSWGDLKHFRSIVGEDMGEAFLVDAPRRSQMKKLYAALSQDMEATAKSQGPKAFNSWKRANDMFAQGQKRIEGALADILGKDASKTPEAAAGVIQRIAKDGKTSGDLKKLAELRKTLRPEEWGQVSNGLIRLLGKPANSEGRDFAADTFVRNFNDMADESKNLLFGPKSNPLRQNLEEFQRVVGLVAKSGGTRNSSNTAMGLSGLAGLSAGGLPGLLAQATLSFGAAKAWTNPAFVRWATGYGKMIRGAAKAGGGITQKTHDSQMKALSRIAAAETAIAQDALGLQAQLNQAFQGGSAKLAAQPVPLAERNEGSTETAGAVQ